MSTNNRILIVDDEERNLKILRIRLSDRYELAEASNGEEALRTIESFDPALLLLDIMMPGMSGYEVTERIKQSSDLQKIKVILVSGKAMIDEKLQGYKAGAEDYLTKPFNSQELLAKVKVFVDLFNLELQQAEANKHLERELQERLRQALEAERLAAIGMRVGELAHDLNNPLAVLVGHVSRLKKLYPDERGLKKIENSIERILEITKGTLKSIRSDRKINMIEVSLRGVLQEEFEYVKMASEHSRPIVSHFECDESIQIFCYQPHLHQIFGNLIKNSVESLYNREKREIRLWVDQDSDFIRVHIQDTGVGIKKEDQWQLFEPLYTTKTLDNSGVVGTGLGLASVKRLIDSYGGTVSISSRVGDGTTVTVSIPEHMVSSHAIAAAA